MSTYFVEARRRIEEHWAGFWRRDLKVALVKGLPAGMDPKCVDGCDLLPYRTVDEIPGLEFFRLPIEHVKGISRRGHSELCLSRDPTWNVGEILAQGSDVLGALMFTTFRRREMPVFLSADPPFPISLKDLAPTETLSLGWSHSPVLSIGA